MILYFVTQMKVAFLEWRSIFFSNGGSGSLLCTHMAGPDSNSPSRLCSSFCRSSRSRSLWHSNDCPHSSLERLFVLPRNPPLLLPPNGRRWSPSKLIVSQSSSRLSDNDEGDRSAEDEKCSRFSIELHRLEPRAVISMGAKSLVA